MLAEEAARQQAVAPRQVLWAHRGRPVLFGRAARWQRAVVACGRDSQGRARRAAASRDWERGAAALAASARRHCAG